MAVSFSSHQYRTQSLPANHVCGKDFQRHKKELKAHLSLICAKLGWLSLFSALILKERKGYFTSVTAKLEIKYYKQSRDIGNLEFIGSTYSVWPDQLEHLNNRLEENGVFNKVQVLQVQRREFENHAVQQIWKTGSPDTLEIALLGLFSVPCDMKAYLWTSLCSQAGQLLNVCCP